MDFLNKSLTKIGMDEFDHFAPLKKLADKLSVKPSYIIAAGSFLILIMMFLSFFNVLITCLVGFLYPAQMSFKALESKEKEDDKQWLTYWVVYAFFTIIDVFLHYIWMVPGQYLFKLAFLIYLFHPKTLGASYIQRIAISPLLKKQEGKLDENLNKITGKAEEYANMAQPYVQQAKQFIPSQQ